MRSKPKTESWTPYEDRSRLLLDSITDYAIYMLDADGIVSTWNPGARRFKGYREEEIIGRHFSVFYTEEDRRAGLPEKALGKARLEGRFENEGWRVRKDGARFWAHVVIDPVRSPSGELIGFAKVTRDLTERRLAEEALRRSEQQFKMLVEGVTDYAIYMLDATGKVESWNAGAQRFKGYKADEVIGQHFSVFYTPEDREARLPETALKAAASEGRFEREGWRVRKDGSRFWAHVVIDRILDAKGALAGFAKVTRDVTERKQAQENLETAQLALFQTQKLESIGQLTGGIAHDFNNLLTAITGSLDLALKRVDEVKTRKLLENAMLGAQRGATLTQRMLAFARRQELRSQSICIPDLVAGMLELMERSIGPSIRVETRYQSGLPHAQSDVNQLESALVNLMVNARDAMPHGGRIDVRARKERLDQVDTDLSPGDYVVLSVTDTGSGMSAETLARAREPFFTTKGIGCGTGLGLSMVHGLAQQSGGALRLESTVGVGTTASIWLPVARNEAPSRPVATIEEASPVRPLRILVVEDDELVLVNSVEMLEEQGHSVVIARNAAEAIETLLRDASIEIIVSDHAMPGMTGIELAQVAKSMKPDLPFVLATGYAEVPMPLEFEVVRLSKPFNQADLAAAIKAGAGEARSPT